MDAPILNKRWCAPNIVMKNIVESVVKEVKQSLIGGMDDTRFRKYIEMTYYLVVFTSATGKILLLRYSLLPLVFPP
jgi:hypothetical protein